MNKFLCLLVVSIITACTISYPIIVELPEFDQELAKKLLEKGKNTITGSAFLKQVDGRVQKCSGSIVLLVPATEFAKKIVETGYRNRKGFYIPVDKSFEFKSVKETDIEKYKSLIRETVCDIDGKFEFENVHDGSFFIETTINWGVVVNQYGNMSSQGGAVMLPVTVKGGETKKVVVTR